MHCLSPDDNPNRGRVVGRKGISPRLLSTNAWRKFDNIRCGGAAIHKIGRENETFMSSFFRFSGIMHSHFRTVLMSLGKHYLVFFPIKGSLKV